MKKLFLRGVVACALLAPAIANAEPPDGPHPGETVVTLSATEHGEVGQDLLTASLSIQADNADPRALQDKINTLMAKALAAAKAVPSVQAATGGYTVYINEPSWDGKGPKPVKSWRGAQDIALKKQKRGRPDRARGQPAEYGAGDAGAELRRVAEHPRIRARRAAGFRHSCG